MKQNFKNCMAGIAVVRVLGTAFLLLAFASMAWAQTAPTPQSLPYSQDFSGLLHTSTVYPAGLQGWQLGTTSSLNFRTTAPMSDLGLTASSSASSTTGGVHNYNGKIGIQASGSADPSICLAINTTGLANIQVGFDAMTIRNPYDGGTNSRINGFDIQYRVGSTAATWVSVSGLANGVYQNNTTTQTTAGVTTPQNVVPVSLALPAACNNQPVVYLRWVQKDISGSGARASFAIDNISICVPAVIGACPSNISLCNTNVATWTNPSASGTPAASVVCSPASGSTFAVGTTLVTCTASNSCGASSSCSFSVNVSNITCQNGGTVNASCGCDCPPGYSGTNCELVACVPPVIGACPSNVIQCDNSIATWTNPTATGTSPTISCTPASGSSFSVGTTAVTCTATNGCGTSSCSFNVTINQSPTISCPSNITVGNTPGQCGANVSFSAGSTGTPAPSVTYVPASGSFFPVGTTSVTATATNSCGTSSCTFSVTVNDNQAPNAICQNISVALNSSGTASITPGMINNGSTDNCGTVNLVSVTPNTFSCANVGVSGATDLFISEYVEGNIGSNKYIEIFNGTSGPVNLGDYRLRLYANGASVMPTNDVLLSGILPAGQTIVYQNSAATLYMGPATNNAAVNFNGDDAIGLFKISANAYVDIFGRIGEDPGTAWIDGVNSTLDHTLRRKATVTQGVSVNPAAGFPTLLSEWDQFPVNDVSGLGAHTYTPPPVATPVTLTINDGNGNTATCTAQVTVQDITPPTALCQNINVPLDASGNASITAGQVNNGSSDNCGIASMTVSPASFNCGNVGPNAVVLTVTDVNGLSSTCSATVTVSDNLPPVASCQNVTVNLDASGNASITAAQVNNNSTDNCGISSMSVSPNTFDCSNATPIAGPSTAWINEIHYDNTGTDAGEFIEIAGNAGLNLNGWSVVLYNGANGLSYNTTALSGTLSNQSNGFGFQVLNYPQDGIQNGSPDGVALINNLGNVIQFLSYEGVFTALNGPANGQTSTDIGVAESGSTPVGFSLQLAGSGSSYSAFSWSSEAANTSGAANNGQTFIAPAGNTVTLTVTDIHGLTSTCTAIVTVNDITPPNVICHNITVPLGSNGTVTVTASQVDNGSTDACGIASMALSQTAFSCANIGPNSVTLTVTDVNGLSASCNATVTIVDQTPPVVNCQSITVQLDASGNASITAAQIDNGSTDNCGILSRSVVPSSFNCTDVAGDPVTDLFISEYIEGSGNNKAIEIFNGTGAAVNLSSGGYALKYYFNGNTSSGLTISLTGTIAPGDVYVVAQSTANAAILAQADQTNGAGWFNGDDAVELVKSGSVRVDLIGRIGEDPGASWNSGGYSTADRTLVRRAFVTQGIVMNPDTGFATLTTEWDVFSTDYSANLGSHTIQAGNLVTLTVNDNYGNSSTCTAYVTVQDVTQPVLTCPYTGVVSRNTDPGACTYTAQSGEFNAAATDNCTVTSLTYQLLGATSGTGTDLNGVAFNKGSTIVRWFASDGNTGTVQCSFAVTVNDGEAPHFSTACPASFAACNAPGISWAEPVAMDNCGSVTLSSNYLPGATFPAGTTTVVYTATDATGNTATCSFEVTVKEESTDPATASASPSVICSGDAVTLSVSGGQLGTGAVARWYTGSCGGTLVGVGPSIMVNTVSTTTYYVRYEGDCNTTNCVAATVTVRDLSVAPTSIASNAAGNIICEGGNVTLTVGGGSLGTNADWEWFENACGFGAVLGNGPTITLSPVGPGVHNYYVRANGPCNVTTCAGISITVATFSVGASSVTSNVPGNSICSGNNVILTANGGSLGTGASWKWYAGSCGGASIGTGPSITVSPSATTTYFVRAEGVCNNTLCSSLTIGVSTSAPTHPATIIGSPQSICSGNQGTFTCQTVSDATFYSWSAPNGTTFDGGNPSPYITSNTTVQVTFGALPNGISGYDICVFAGNGCGQSQTKCKYVRGRVVQPSLISGLNNSCPNTSSVYSCTSSPGADSYLWTITGNATFTNGNNTISTNGTSVTVNFGSGWTSGTLSVQAVMNCGYMSIPKTITIISTPAAAGPISGNSTVCPSLSYPFSVASVPGATIYNWSTNVVGAVVTGTGSNCSIQFPSVIPAGAQVCVSVTGSCGTSAQTCKSIGTGLAAAPGTISGPTDGQCGQTGVSYSILPVAGATAYQWSVNNGASISGPNNLTAVSVNFTSSPGATSVSVVAVNGCGNSAPQIAVVQSVPGQPGIISGINNVCSGGVYTYSSPGAGGATGYNWNVPFSVGTILADNGSSIDVLITGTSGTNGSITLTASNACGDGPVRTFPVSVACRLAQMNATTGMAASLFPNPATSQTTLKFEAALAGNYRIELMDIAGRILSSESIHAVEGVNMHDISLGTFSKGMYMIRLEGEGMPSQILQVTIE